MTLSGIRRSLPACFCLLFTNVSIMILLLSPSSANIVNRSLFTMKTVEIEGRSRRNSRDNCYNIETGTVKRYPLSLGVLLPESYRRRIEPSIDLALEHVHATPNLLMDYCLHLIYKDTQCKTSLGMKSLFDLMNMNGPDSSGDTVSMLLDQSFKEDGDETDLQSLLNDINASDRPAALFGDVCTDVNEPVAMASKYWDILHLSYAETHAKFATADSKHLYPTFFRIVPGDRNLIRARSHLVKFFNWTRVGTIKQSDEPFYSLPHERLTTVLENSHNVRIIYTAGLSNDQINNIANELEELKRRDAHIIIGDFSAQLALHVLCEAYHLQMYGADYLWILPGYHRGDWWRAATPPLPRSTVIHQHTDTSNLLGTATTLSKTCTTDQIQTVLQGHFAMEFAPLRSYSSISLVSNRTITQLQRELRDFCRHKQAYCPEDVHSAYAYDGIWTLALALNATLYREGGATRLTRSVLASQLLPHVASTSFEGLTGRVRFENNERLGLIHILQWMNGSYSKVGFSDSAENTFFLQPLNGWSSPLDATVVKRERQYVSYYLLGIMSLLSLIGILLALIFFVVNVKFRNHRFIKMSSPNMNNLIIIGSMFAYAAVFLLGIDTRFVSGSTFEKLCYAKTWVLSVGFTLAFGSMFSKTWRVHSIFTNIRRDKKAIKDTQLFLIVAAILLLDVVVLGAWALISPFHFSIFELHTFRHKNVLIVPELERCVSNFSVFFQVIFYVFKGMLMIFGCFLAWETRAVNVPALNDSKYIGMCVYLVVVMCIVGLSLAFVLQERINEAFVLISFFIVCCTTLTLLLVFMPKVIELIRARGTDQEKRYNHKRLMKSMVGSSGGGNSSVIRRNCDPLAGDADPERLSRELSLRSSEGADMKEKICAIEEDNLRLHEILIAKSTELWDVLERLRVLGESVRGQNGGSVICVGAQITGQVISMNDIAEKPPLNERIGQVTVYRTVSERTNREELDAFGDTHVNSYEDVDDDDDVDEEEEILLVAEDDDTTMDKESTRIVSLQHDSEGNDRQICTSSDSECVTNDYGQRLRLKQSSVPAGLCGLLLPATGEMAKSGTVLAMTLIAATEANYKRQDVDNDALENTTETETTVNSGALARLTQRRSTLFDVKCRLRHSITASEYNNRRHMPIPLSRSEIGSITSATQPSVTIRATRKANASAISLRSSANDVYYETISNFSSSNRVISAETKNEGCAGSDCCRWDVSAADEDEDSVACASRRHRNAARQAHNSYRLLENSCSASSSMQSVLTHHDVVASTPVTMNDTQDGTPDSTESQYLMSDTRDWISTVNSNGRRRVRKKFPISTSFT